MSWFLLAAMGYIAISSMETMNVSTEVLYEKHLKGLHEVDEANTCVAHAGRSPCRCWRRRQNRSKRDPT